jgi:hypothetical protein
LREYPVAGLESHGLSHVYLRALGYIITERLANLCVTFFAFSFRPALRIDNYLSDDNQISPWKKLIRSALIGLS